MNLAAQTASQPATMSIRLRPPPAAFYLFAYPIFYFIASSPILWLLKMGGAPHNAMNLFRSNSNGSQLHVQSRFFCHPAFCSSIRGDRYLALPGATCRRRRRLLARAILLARITRARLISPPKPPKKHSILAGLRSISGGGGGDTSCCLV